MTEPQVSCSNSCRASTRVDMIGNLVVAVIVNSEECVQRCKSRAVSVNSNKNIRIVLSYNDGCRINAHYTNEIEKWTLMTPLWFVNITAPLCFIELPISLICAIIHYEDSFYVWQVERKSEIEYIRLRSISISSLFLLLMCHMEKNIRSRTSFCCVATKMLRKHWGDTCNKVTAS